MNPLSPNVPSLLLSALAAGGSDVVAVGAHIDSATADFGGGPRTTPGATHDELGVIAVYDGTGSYQWDRELPLFGAEGFAPHHLAVNASGTVAHASPYTELGGSSGVYIGTYTAAGTSLWTKNYYDGLGAISFERALGLDATGGVQCKMVNPQGAHDFGGGAMVNPVVDLDATGHYAAGKSLPDALSVFDAAGNLYIEAAVSGCGPANATLTKLDATAGCVWGKALFSGNGTPAWYGVAADPGGGLLFHAGFATTLDIGCGPVANFNKLGYLVAKLDATGTCVWQKLFTSPDFDSAGLTLTSDGLGDFVMSGPFTGSIDLGGGAVTAPSGGALLAKLDPTGAFRWIKTPSSTYFFVAGGPPGDVFVGSSVQGFDLGTGPLLIVDGIVLAKLAP